MKEKKNNRYKVTHVNKSIRHIETTDKLIETIRKSGEGENGGGYHPIVTGADEWMLNMDHVVHIENVTPEDPE